MTEWRPIPACPSYEISDEGSVRSWKWGRPYVLAARRARRDRYMVATMQVDGRQITRSIHELVMTVFIGPRPEGLERRHLNGDSFDNRLTNLAYGTHSENMLDKVRHGTHHEAAKTHCPKKHPLDGRRSNGKRYCKTCNRASSARRRALIAIDPERSAAARRYFHDYYLAHPRT